MGAWQSERVAEALVQRLADTQASRIILLGSIDAMQDANLKHEIARRGVAVLVPPMSQQIWIGMLTVAVASEASVSDAAPRLGALLADGLEHGVEAIVLLYAALAPYVRACKLAVPVIEAWDLLSEGAAVKDVVFDMGGVLLRWEPMRMAREVAGDEGDAKLLCAAVFESTEWVWQDAGAVGEDTVAWAAKTRVPVRLHAAVDELVYHWHDNRRFVEGMDVLIADLKAAGYGVYLLSNAGESFRTYCQQLPGWGSFDGVIVSCFEHAVKPDLRIYRILLERYGLDAAHCLFVDDMERNVIGARRAGMQGWRFDGDIAALRKRIGIA